MKKKYEFNNMLRDLRIIDLSVGIVLAIITYIINKYYLGVCLLGFILAILSFYINSYVTKYVFNNKSNNYGLVVFSYFIRIFIVTIIGIITFTYNKFNVIAYMFGYTFRFFSLIFYAVLQEN